MRGHVHFIVVWYGVHSGFVHLSLERSEPDRGINPLHVLQNLFRLHPLTQPGPLPRLHINIRRSGHNPFLIVHRQSPADYLGNHRVLLLLKQEGLHGDFVNKLLL